VDQANRVVDLKLNGSNTTVRISMEPNREALYRHSGHPHSLQDVKTGDSITVSILAAAPQA